MKELGAKKNPRYISKGHVMVSHIFAFVCMREFGYYNCETTKDNETYFQEHNLH